MTPGVLQLAAAVADRGGHLWVVGGSVRDALLGRPMKDLDLEVHGLETAPLRRVLLRFGPAHEVGKDFPVFKLRLDDLDLDVSLPRASRREEVDPLLGLTEAARRRDLTINAMALDPLTGQITDPFGGRADLEARLLRAVDSRTFLDDPLRALRVLQFAARFDFAVDAELTRLCAVADLSQVAPERVEIELEKLLLKAERPSIGLQLGRATGVLAQVLPELLQTPGAQMDQAVDRAALRRQGAGPPPRPYALMLCALLHGLGSQDAERVLDRLRLHARSGYPLRQRVLEALASWPLLTRPASDPTLRGLAERAELGLVAETAWAATGAEAAIEALDRAEALGITHGPMLPLIGGRDLARLGMQPGPAMGRLLSQVREAQIQGTVSDPEGALALARQTLSSIDANAD